MRNNCGDMSVCGSNCFGDGNGLNLSSAIILPVNNYAKNYLRISTCELGLNAEIFARNAVIFLSSFVRPRCRVLTRVSGALLFDACTQPRPS